MVKRNKVPPSGASKLPTLRVLREARRMSQARLAEKAALSSSLIYQVEAGLRSLGPEAAKKAARALDADAVTLAISTNVAGLMAAIKAGRESPRRAAGLARELLRMLEDDELTPDQAVAARAGALQLAAVIEEAARGRGTLESIAAPSRAVEDSVGRFDPGDESWSESYEAAMVDLGRDRQGRRRTTRGADAVDPGLDYNLESGEYPARFARRKQKPAAPNSTYDDLDRDSFGRRKPQ